MSYPYIFNVRVKAGTRREDLVREVLNFYGLTSSDTTRALDRLLEDFNSVRAFYDKLDRDISEKEEELRILRGRKIGNIVQ